MKNSQLKLLIDEPDKVWQSIVDRDASYDGKFVFAVTTTGIYCRPSCPARQPKRNNVRLFESPVEAEAAGFRSCKRCHPASLSLEEIRINAVIQACGLIESTPEAMSLNEIAKAVGYSPSYFHRLFKRLVGVTLKAYADGKRVKRLQEKLLTDRTVIDAIYNAGYSSGSRVYESAKKTLGMTPAEYQSGGKNQSIQYIIESSPLGLILVGATDKGVCCIEIGGNYQLLLESLHRRFPAASLTEDIQHLKKLVIEIISFIIKPTHDLNLPLDIQGSAFQLRVWHALQEIPLGQTTSYQEIAKSVGKPTAQRAVAQACAANKLAIAIPCHRVIRSNGELGGYCWGIERKQQLLNQEKDVTDK